MREAYKNGTVSQERVVRTVEVFNQEDIKYEEAKFIGEANPLQLVNMNMPRPDLSRVTVALDESKSKEDELDTISEAMTV